MYNQYQELCNESNYHNSWKTGLVFRGVKNPSHGTECVSQPHSNFREFFLFRSHRRVQPYGETERIQPQITYTVSVVCVLGHYTNNVEDPCEKMEPGEFTCANIKSN